MSFIKKYIFPGILFFVPVFITIYVIVKTVSAMDRIFLLLPQRFRPEAFLHVKIPGLGVFFTFLMIFIAGVVARSYVGMKLINLFESIMDRIPLVGLIHATLKDFLQAVLGEKSEHFRHVVVAEFPRKGMYSIGFVTNLEEPKFYGEESGEKILVFFPTTPNPTTGFIVAVPRSEVRFIDMTVEEAFRFLLTAGTVAKGKN